MTDLEPARRHGLVTGDEVTNGGLPTSGFMEMLWYTASSVNASAM
jgi:hypothetical protein